MRVPWGGGETAPERKTVSPGVEQVWLAELPGPEHRHGA